MSAGARRWPLLIAALALSACGFRLAGSGDLPPGLSPMVLQTQGFDAAQRAALSRRLRQAGARLVDEPAGDASRLVLRLEAPPDTRLVSGSGSRSVSRVERRLVFDLQRPGGEPLGAKTLVQRIELSSDDDKLLAAGEQRAAVVAELENALYNLLVSQLLRL